VKNIFGCKYSNLWLSKSSKKLNIMTYPAMIKISVKIFLYFWNYHLIGGTMKKKLSTFIIVSAVLIGGMSLFSMPVAAPDPPYLPDLTISQENITFSHSTFIAGLPITIDATVWNVGNADVDNVEVNFYEENILIDSEYVNLPVNRTWTNYTMESDGEIGKYSSIAIDDANNIHISYLDNTDDILKYAYRPSEGSWSIYTVDFVGNGGLHTSIVVDGAKGVHISYYDGTNGDLKYAYKTNGGSWAIETVDSAGQVGRSSSITLDSANGVHIGYRGENGDSLKYAYKPSGGAWTNQTVDSVGEVGAHPSIALDDSNGVHMNYLDITNQDLKYAYKPDGGSWNTYTIESEGQTGHDSSIAIDSANGVHMSYNSGSDTLKYAYKPYGGNWANYTVDSTTQTGSDTSIALDNTYGIHISYRDQGYKDLKYAFKPNGGNWTTHTVDSKGDIGLYTSIAIGNNNEVHISYCDYANLDLKYANLEVQTGNVHVSIPWTPTTAGFRNITVKIDENNLIEELNETNNNATVSVTVEPGYNGTIVIEPESSTLELNETQQFNATGMDDYGNEAPISVIWQVNGGGTIDQNGLFTALYPGSWIVQAVDENQPNFTAQADVTVQVNMTADTDSDGILDWWEVAYGLDPFNESDADLDPDLDGLTNLQEFLNYSKPNINDTDGDSLGDGFEVIFSKTNASLWDTNGNGVGDGLEFIQSKGYLGWIESLPDDWIGMTITWDNYTILVKTNSSVLEGEFDKEEQKLKIKVSGPEGTQGVTELEVPKGLCEPEDIEIQLDGELINYTLTEDDTYYYIHIEYNHSIHELSAIFSQTIEIPDQQPGDEKGLLEHWSFIGMIIALIIIVILLILITRIRGKEEDIGVQELPPEQLLILLEKQHDEGKITDETYEDAKSLLMPSHY
jgi:hypothetical protein